MLTTVLLIAMAAPVAEKTVSTQITGLENGSVTITTSKGIKFEGVKTPDGPRIRIETEGLVIEATKLRVIVKNQLVTMAINKDGTIDQTGELLPPKKP